VYFSIISVVDQIRRVNETVIHRVSFLHKQTSVYLTARGR